MQLKQSFINIFYIFLYTLLIGCVYQFFTFREQAHQEAQQVLSGVERQLTQIQSELHVLSNYLFPLAECDKSMQTELGHTVFRSISMRGLFVGIKQPDHYQFCSNLGAANQPLDNSFWNEARKGDIGFAKLRSPTHDGNTSFALALYRGENVAIATINPTAILGWWVQEAPQETHRILHFSNDETPLLEKHSTAFGDYKATKESLLFPISISVYKDTALYRQGIVTFIVRLLVVFGVVVGVIALIGFRKKQVQPEKVQELK
ncbi:hypothetical protein ACQKP3_06635 [Vibrio sp. DNB22_10_4]